MEIHRPTLKEKIYFEKKPLSRARSSSFSPAARVKHGARLWRFKGVTMERGVVRAAVGTLLVHAIPPRAALTAIVAFVRACAHGSFGAHATQNNRWRA